MLGGKTAGGLDGVKELFGFLADAGKVKNHLDEVAKAESRLKELRSVQDKEIEAAKSEIVKRGKVLETKETDLAARLSAVSLREHQTKEKETKLVNDRRTLESIDTKNRAEVSAMRQGLESDRAVFAETSGKRNSELSRLEVDLKTRIEAVEKASLEAVRREHEAAKVKEFYEERMKKLKEAIS